MTSINPVSLYQEKINQINNRINVKLQSTGVTTDFKTILRSAETKISADTDNTVKNNNMTAEQIKSAIQGLGINTANNSVVTSSQTSVNNNLLASALAGYNGSMSNNLLNSAITGSSTDNINNDVLSLLTGINNINDQTNFVNLLSNLVNKYNTNTKNTSVQTENNINKANSSVQTESKTNTSAYAGNGYFGMENINPNSEIANRTDYEYLIGKAADKFGVNSTLIKAIIKAESDFNPECISSAGAVGLMQLMPGTAKLMGVENSKDPEQNINGGVGYFKQQLDSFDGNIKMALAAYNCGPSKLKSLNITNIDDKTQFARLPKETQNYVTKIINSIK